MAPEQKDLLNLRTMPARLSVTQTAHILNCGPHDIPVLIDKGLLKPLGKPRANTVKWFATTAIKRLAEDERLMHRLTDVLQEYWQRKNIKRHPAKESAVTLQSLPRRQLA